MADAAHDKLITQIVSDFGDKSVTGATKLSQDALKLLMMDGQNPSQVAQDVQRIASGAHLTPADVAKQFEQLGFPKIGLGDGEGAQLTDAAKPVIAAGNREAIQLANDHLGDLVKLGASMPPGKIDVASAFAMADMVGIKPEKALAALGLNVDAQAISMLRNVKTIEKDGNGHVVITQNSDTALPLNLKVPHGQINDIKLGRKISFDIDPNSTRVSNIQGVDIEGEGGIGPIHKRVDSKLENLDIGRDGEGRTVVRASASNPENWLEKIFTGDRGSEIPMDIQLQPDGRVILSQRGRSTTIGHV